MSIVHTTGSYIASPWTILALDPFFAHIPWEDTLKPTTKKELSPEVVGEGSWVSSRGM